MAMWGIHMFQQIGPVAISEGYVALGWHELGDLSPIAADRESFKSRYREAYPAANPNSIPVSAGVLYRFVHDIEIGEYIIFPSSHNSMVNIGRIASNYYYDLEQPEEFPNRRRVTWLKHVPRLFFSQQSRNEIGAAIALFQISNNEDEFLRALEGQVTEPEVIDEPSPERVSEQIVETTEDFIISRLKKSQTPYQFEHFIAHLLRCMGYQSRVTQASGDGGVDIIAHRDELGFDPPLIKVQVKQIISTIGSPDVQQLVGAIAPGEKALFVTLGSFSGAARNIERTNPNLRLIDGSALIELIYTHYHKFEPRYQMLLPLKRTYIPGGVFGN